MTSPKDVSKCQMLSACRRMCQNAKCYPRVGTYFYVCPLVWALLTFIGVFRTYIKVCPYNRRSFDTPSNNTDGGLRLEWARKNALSFVTIVTPLPSSLFSLLFARDPINICKFLNWYLREAQLISARASTDICNDLRGYLSASVRLWIKSEDILTFDNKNEKKGFSFCIVLTYSPLTEVEGTHVRQ